MRLVCVAAACAALALLIPCIGYAKTRQARNVDQSGFLGDYSQLREGRDKEAIWVFLDPDTDWKAFGTFHIESVSLWKSKKLDELTAGERNALCDYLYQAVNRELSQVIPSTRSPGPQTLVIRAAITEADAANVALNSVTSIVPQTRLLSTLGGLASDTAVLVGEASIEVEALEGRTDSVRTDDIPEC